MPIVILKEDNINVLGQGAITGKGELMEYHLREVDAGGKETPLMISHSTLAEAKLQAKYYARTYKGLSYRVVRYTRKGFRVFCTIINQS